MKDSKSLAAGSAEPDAGEISLIDLALILAENLRLLIVVPLAAGLVSLGIAFLIPPTFSATTRVLPPTQQQGAAAAMAAQLGSLAGLVGGAAGIKNPADQYAALLRSFAVYDAIIRRFNLRDLYGARYIEDARRALDKRTLISVGAKDSIISIEVDDNDPKQAAAMANAFVEELRNLSNTLAVTESAQRRLFFELQLKQAKENLTQAEVALRSSGVSAATLKTVPQSALESLARLKAQITVQEVKLSSMRSFMTDSNPEFRLATQELTALRSALASAEKSDSVKAGSAGADYIAMYRNFKYNETLFELMARQYELARLDEAREGAIIQVVDIAKPPERKSKPRRGLIALLTTITVFMLIVFSIVTRHALSSAGESNETAEKLARLWRLLRLRRR